MTTWEFLRAHGLPLVEAVFCATVEEVQGAAERLGYPVVAKVDHPQLSHKTDVGGVRLGLRTPHEVRTAALDLLGLAPDCRVVVQPQRVGVELLVGALAEPTFGPVVCFGTGGVLLEVTDDVVFAPAPLSRAEAHALLARPRASRLLDGVRGAPGVKRAAVADVIQIAAALVATYPAITELDLNPVVAGPEGCAIVDARLVRAPPSR